MIPNPVNQRPHELSKPRASGDDPNMRATVQAVQG